MALNEDRVKRLEEALTSLRQDFEAAEQAMTLEARGAVQLSGEIADGVKELRRQYEWRLTEAQERADAQIATIKEHFQRRTQTLTDARNRFKRTLDDVVNEVFTIADSYQMPEAEDPNRIYGLGRIDGLSHARYAVLRGLGVFEPNHVEYVERPGSVYIAEAIWWEENVADGRNRLGTYLTLEDALMCIKNDAIHGDPALVATAVEYSALHGKGGDTWAVHRQGEDLDDFGNLWITREELR